GVLRLYRHPLCCGGSDCAAGYYRRGGVSGGDHCRYRLALDTGAGRVGGAGDEYRGADAALLPQ
ncbi:MAG: hypothetical protein ABI456_20360, partial [Ktedonobacteraceae bacterium]